MYEANYLIWSAEALSSMGKSLSSKNRNLLIRFSGEELEQLRNRTWALSAACFRMETIAVQRFVSRQGSSRGRVRG